MRRRRHAVMPGTAWCVRRAWSSCRVGP